MNVVELQELIEDTEYPTTREELLTRAKQWHSDEDVMYAISQLPNIEYEIPTDVRQAIVEFVF